MKNIEEEIINANVITVDDCLQLYEMKSEAVMINDGIIVGTKLEKWERDEY